MTDQTYVLRIPPQRGHFMGFDLDDVLDLLGDKVWSWHWRAEGLDRISNELGFWEEIRTEGGSWLTTKQLIELSKKITQTIDGRFYAFPEYIKKKSLTLDDLNLDNFATNNMRLAILAVDSSFFEVYTRDESIATAIQSRFADVTIRS